MLFLFVFVFICSSKSFVCSEFSFVDILSSIVVVATSLTGVHSWADWRLAWYQDPISTILFVFVVRFP